MTPRALGIYRENEFSPGKVEADAAILDSALAELTTRGFTTSTLDAKSFASGAPIEADLVLAMCQSEGALRRLAEVQAGGVLAVNSALAIRNCYRDLLGGGLIRAGVPTPNGALIATGVPIDLRALVGIDLDAGIYLKRGDLHALSPQDVERFDGRSSLLGGIASFAGRGVRTAYVQEAVEGSTVKFLI